MKLDEFLEAKMQSLTDTENLHVIGTCGECECFIPENVDSNLHECRQGVSDVLEDFGCIYFKPKGKGAVE